MGTDFMSSIWTGRAKSMAKARIVKNSFKALRIG
jgi:hypothetical protein